MAVAKKKTAARRKTAKKPAAIKRAVKKPARKRVAAKKKTTTRKTAAKKKTTARRTAGKKITTARKTTARKKPAARTTTRKAAPKKKTTKAKTKRKPNAAFMRPMTLSPALSEVVGSKPIPRTEVTKKLWIYIKKNDLQDAKNRRMINADAKLLKVFGGKKQVNMFLMTKLVSKHMK